MYCPECGTEVDSEASFCSGCGASLEPQTDAVEPEPDPAPDPGMDDSATSTDTSVADFDADDVDVKTVLIALGLAIVPALVAYVGISISTNSPIPLIFYLGIPVFGYVIYQNESWKGMLSTTSFWLSVEIFLVPVALLLYTLVFASGTSTTAGAAGAAIGGFLLIGAAFVVCIPLGIALYLLSRRLDPE